MSVNRAAWLRHKMAYPYEVDDAPMPTPEPNQVIIRVGAVAINPADWWVQAKGLVYETFPAIPGCDAAGEITELGSAVQGLQVGDRVTASLDAAAFQLYVAATSSRVAKIPDKTPFTEAVVLPLGMMTSAVCLFEDDMLALDIPRVEGAAPNGKVLLVWGGSSVLGSCAIQQARAAGYEVAAVAGKHNLDYCKKLGAQYVFDREDGDIVDHALEVLRGKDCAGAFCTIVAEGLVGKCAQTVDGLKGHKFVSCVYPPGMEIPDHIPDGVKIGQSWRAPLGQSDVATGIFSSWLPGALANGTMVCLPEAEIVGEGLEKTQEAVDRVAKGVSAKKLVVKIA